MKFGIVLTIAAIVLFAVAAVFIFVDSAAIAPLGLIACGLACATAARIT